MVQGVWMRQLEKSKNTQVLSDDSEKFNTRSVVKTLENLMIRVTENECTPDTVNAACNCAEKVTDILRLHLDVEKLKSLRR